MIILLIKMTAEIKVNDIIRLHRCTVLYDFYIVVKVCEKTINMIQLKTDCITINPDIEYSPIRVFPTDEIDHTKKVRKINKNKITNDMINNMSYEFIAEF